LKLSCVPIKSRISQRSKFRFENSWLVEPEFKPFVHQCWNYVTTESITDKLNICAEEMSNWNKNHGQKTRREIEKVRRKLDLARTQVTADNVQHFNELHRSLDTLLVKDNLYWKQRAKTFWYKEGDLNTRFYHAAALTRRKINKIDHLQDISGATCRNEEGLKSIARDYFVELFQKGPTDQNSVVAVVNTVITGEDNYLVTTPFSLKEFKEATFSMQADKCPGPDGFDPGFYRNFWNTCGQEVFHAGCSWLAEGVFPPNLNSTNITLIPKGDTQESMKD